MPLVKLNQPGRIRVRALSDPDGTSMIGVPAEDVEVSVYRPDGSADWVTVNSSNWTELEEGVFSGSGTYEVILPAFTTNIPGTLMVGVVIAGARFVCMEVTVTAPSLTFTGGGNTENPVISTAIAPRRNQLRISFSEPVIMTTGSNGALNINNYVIDNLQVLSVIAETDRQVLITTTTQTPGVRYDFTISNIEDFDGNPVVTNA